MFLFFAVIISVCYFSLEIDGPIFFSPSHSSANRMALFESEQQQQQLLFNDDNIRLGRRSLTCKLTTIVSIENVQWAIVMFLVEKIRTRKEKCARFNRAIELHEENENDEVMCMCEWMKDVTSHLVDDKVTERERDREHTIDTLVVVTCGRRNKHSILRSTHRQLHHQISRRCLFSPSPSPLFLHELRWRRRRRGQQQRTVFSSTDWTILLSLFIHIRSPISEPRFIFSPCTSSESNDKNLRIVLLFFLTVFICSHAVKLALRCSDDDVCFCYYSSWLWCDTFIYI